MNIQDVVMEDRDASEKLSHRWATQGQYRIKPLKTPPRHSGVIQEASRPIEERKQTRVRLNDRAQDSRDCNRNGDRNHDRNRDRDLKRDHDRCSQSDLRSSRDNTGGGTAQAGEMTGPVVMTVIEDQPTSVETFDSKNSLHHGR